MEDFYLSQALFRTQEILDNFIERTLQRLSFEAECASRGTDASSEEHRMVQRKAREEAERKRREADIRSKLTKDRRQPKGAVERLLPLV